MDIPSIKRTKILYHILLVLMLVSIVPMILYGWQQIKLNRERLETNERLTQYNIAQSLADEIYLFINNYREQMLLLSSALEHRGGLEASESFEGNQLLEKRLEQFVAQSTNVIFVSLVNDKGKGVRAGSYNAADVSIQDMLAAAFRTSIKNGYDLSNPIIIEMGNDIHPVVVVSVPIKTGEKVIGVITVILKLDDILHWVTERSKGFKTVYVVDSQGQVVVHPQTRRYITGMDVSGEIEIVREFVEKSKENKGRNNPLTTPFEMMDHKKKIQMLGTYCPILETSWGVIVQVRQADAFQSVTEMKKDALVWGMIMLLLAVLVGSLSARSIISPIQQLVEGTRSIARGDFSKKITIRSRTEIGELAETFNKMTEDLRLYIEQLQWAAKKNRDLFVGTIRALAAAIDEKDPYTRGHSERVTQYALLIARRMGRSEVEIETLKIAALLHDVGKIGIDDSVLKKPGILNDSEFEQMKQHPGKGANIMLSIDELRDMIPGMKHHHEQWDGNGYPDKLRGELIPPIARIISVADTFDAMTTDRPYQKAFDLEATFNKIKINAGIKYDPKVVEALEVALKHGDFAFAFPNLAAKTV